MNKLVVGSFVVLILTACTGGGGSDAGSIVEPVKEIIGDIIGTTPADVKNVQKKVQTLQQNSNQDPNYLLSKEEQELLLTESLIDDPSEIKDWVK